ncbi:MAG: cysteine desulfurase [Deltaproteobacteria bacterium]|jgi:cysteine desulfurase|nr:cysteine desulfurase [Deltaproteobacteria bacterium]MBW2530002.1 cysteine desulfurase [Deltaproteobacteria bacterium]
MNESSLPVYLDHNATTPVLPEVLDAMLPYLRKHFGNPSSNHVYGRLASDAVERAREQVAALVGCAAADVIFTSGGTEANNLAILGSTAGRVEPGSIVTSTVEHPATAEPCRLLERRGWRVDRVAVDEKGCVVAERAVETLREDTALVTIMHANNETGSVQPIATIAAAAHDRGALVHTDAAQSAGKIPVRMAALGADLVSIAGHKLYGPKGVGALCLGPDATIAPVLWGANHEGGRRPGTENVASIAGLGAACAIAADGVEEEATRVRELRDRLWAKLADRIPGLKLNGHPEARLPNTLNVRFPGVRGSAMLTAAPEIAASTGSACHDGGESASAVLLAAGVDPEAALGSVRLSLGRLTDEQAIEVAAGALERAWQRLAGDG